jgi:hypothetical protein
MEKYIRRYLKSNKIIKFIMDYKLLLEYHLENWFKEWDEYELFRWKDKEFFENWLEGTLDEVLEVR